MPIRVLIADDSPVMRRAIRGLLSSEPEIEIVGEARNVDEMCDLKAKLRPDIVVMDLHLLDEREAAEAQLALCDPGSKFLAISARNPEEAGPRAESLGVAAFLDKMKLDEMLIPKLRELATG